MDGISPYESLDKIAKAFTQRKKIGFESFVREGGFFYCVSPRYSDLLELFAKLR